MPTAKCCAENLNICQTLHPQWRLECGTDLHDDVNRSSFDHSSKIKQQYVPNSTMKIEK
jgi:hypothetical protein